MFRVTCYAACCELSTHEAVWPQGLDRLAKLSHPWVGPGSQRVEDLCYVSKCEQKLKTRISNYGYKTFVKANDSSSDSVALVDFESHVSVSCASAAAAATSGGMPKEVAEVGQSDDDFDSARPASESESE